MKKSTLFALWGGMFVLCAGLGFVPEPAGLVKWLLVMVSVGFFVPGWLLLRQAAKDRDAHTIQLIRNLAAASLIATVVLLMLNFLTALASETLGTVLYYLLVIVSSPMVCAQYWVLSLFFWAYLMIDAAGKLKQKK